MIGVDQAIISIIERSERTRENPDVQGATAANAAKLARVFGRSVTEDQILYPGNYATAETVLPEPTNA